MEDNKASKPTKQKQNQRFPPKRGQVIINILKGNFGWKMEVGLAQAQQPQTMEDKEAPKPTKRKQNQRFPPKRGQVLFNILKGNSGWKRRENGGELSSSSTTPAATPSLYNSDAEFES
ncbi:hypothetical protein Q3G72_031887 [Acer saccharum]|nr:hypothetical protein Q3G72_031887 [Acer saccharum]